MYMQPLENILSLKLENKVNFLLGMLLRRMLHCVPRVRWPGKIGKEKLSLDFWHGG